MFIERLIPAGKVLSFVINVIAWVVMLIIGVVVLVVFLQDMRVEVEPSVPLPNVHVVD